MHRSVLDYDPSDLTPGDLLEWSRMLDNVRRWNGQSSWTVAGHCMMVADIAAFLERPDRGVQAVLDVHSVRDAALLHDLHEAVWSDIPSPVKELVPEIRDAEALWVSGVFTAADLVLSPPRMALVKRADRVAACLESGLTAFELWADPGIQHETNTDLLTYKAHAEPHWHGGPVFVGEKYPGLVQELLLRRLG